MAESCAQYLAKGRQIPVTGRLADEEWPGEDGSKRSKHEIVADNVEFLDRPADQPASASHRGLVPRRRFHGGAGATEPLHDEHAALSTAEQNPAPRCCSTRFTPPAAGACSARRRAARAVERLELARALDRPHARHAVTERKRGSRALRGPLRTASNARDWA